MIGPLVLGLVVASMSVTSSPPISRDDDSCSATAGFSEAAAVCPQDSGAEIDHNGAAQVGSDNVYAYVPVHACNLPTDTGACYGEVPCDGGSYHHEYVNGDYNGIVCVSDSAETPPATVVLTVGTILTAFEQISWPAPTLRVQPPGGKTLVNLETIFSTDLEGPVTRTVTLLGQRITLTATPVRYTWHPGGGAEAWTTDHSGAPWTDGADPRKLNHHVYTDAHVTVSPRASVTYRGTFRINDGPEQPLPGEHTVVGPEVSLRIAEAIPTLTW